MSMINITKYSVAGDFDGKYATMIQNENYMKKLMEFCRSQSGLKGIVFDGTEPELQTIITDLEKIVNYIPSESQHAFGTYLIDELKNEPQFSKVGTIFQYLINNWDTVKELSVTFKLAAELTRIDDWHNYTEDWERYLNLVNGKN